MHRVILIRIGGRKLHLLKVVGALILTGAALGVLDAIAGLFRLIKQIEIAKTNPTFAIEVFGITSNVLTNDVILGLFMLPIAIFLLWLALFGIGTIVYRSGELIVPIEEEIEEVKKKK